MEPTAREYDALTSSIRDLTTTIKDLRDEMSSTYVRKDVIEPQLLEIRKDVAQHGTYFDWIVKLVGAVVIVALLGTILVQNGVVK